MLDHCSLGVTDYKKSCSFYDAILAPLGYKKVMDFGTAAGYGATPEQPMFWLGAPEDAQPIASRGTHVAFSAPNRKAVDTFYAVAIKAGGKDNGKPGLRPNYHPNYYGAFVIDLDGHHIEAVCHKPE